MHNILSKFLLTETGVGLINRAIVCQIRKTIRSNIPTGGSIDLTLLSLCILCATRKRNKNMKQQRIKIRKKISPSDASRFRCSMRNKTCHVHNVNFAYHTIHVCVIKEQQRNGTIFTIISDFCASVISCLISANEFVWSLWMQTHKNNAQTIIIEWLFFPLHFYTSQLTIFICWFQLLAEINWWWSK